MADAPLNLTALDAEDLTVISACLQDALALVGEIVYQPRRRRLAAVFSRFRWETDTGGGRSGSRVRTGVHFDGVLSVKYRGLSPDPDALLSLLAIRVEPGEDGAATVVLEFAGGGQIQLDVEAIACYLSDLTRPWRARRRPAHPADRD